MKLYVDQLNGGYRTRTEPTFAISRSRAILGRKTHIGYWDVFLKERVEVATSSDYIRYERP